jgi:hypothetical protein
MAKSKTKTSDGSYLLKMVLYLIVGSQWLFFTDQGMTKTIPIPLGFIIGIMFASHDHFKIDRKIEYALLLAAMLVGFMGDIGVFVNVLSN